MYHLLFGTGVKQVRYSKKGIKKRTWDIDWTCPESWLSKLMVRPYKISKFLCIFFILGVFLQQKYPFPRFYSFVGIFLFIGIACICSEKYYCKKIQKITSALCHQKCAAVSNAFMDTWGTSSMAFAVVPTATVLVFGTGGCMMFGAIQLTPTLIWVLLLFSIVVAISIVGYLQYMNLAVYIEKLSHSTERYKALPKGPANYVPAELSWIQDLTRLSHIYQAVFFTVGCAYITAFSGFCFWPDMAAEINTPCFYVLWTIIFAAIVLAFPIISVLERKWIKRIIQHLKESYIYDLEQEQKLLKKTYPEKLTSIVVSISARQILDSKDYPFHSLWGSGYAVAMTLINLATTVTTIFTDTLPFISGLRQFFL